jgi:hypothetical protein
MKDLVYLSRAFVEFGPFSKAEILDFQKRGLLNDSDYLRNEGTDAWLPCQEWMSIIPLPAPKVVKRPAAKSAKPATKAAAPPAKKKKAA